MRSIEPNGLPDWLAKTLDAVLKGAGKAVAVPLFHDLLKYVKGKQSQHVHDAHDNTTMVFDEISAMAKGVCDALGADRCKTQLKSQEEFAEQIALMNYLPELIRMSCTMVGATRTATAHGKLLQLRALDFGAVPFSNWGMIVVHHKDEALVDNLGAPGKFAMVTFPGFVGAVSGFNSAGLIQSEKVSYNAMAAGYPKPCYKPGGLDLDGCVPGTYAGEGLPFVLRRFIETSANKAQAEDVIANAKRTWHVYLGLGDSDTMDFDVVGYAWKQYKIWNNSNLFDLSGTERIQDVTFLDKSVQPETSTDLHDILSGLAGTMTGRHFAAYVPHAHGSGDVHHFVVDHGEGAFYVALGTTTDDGTKFIRKACDAPVVAFNLARDVWTMPPTPPVPPTPAPAPTPLPSPSPPSPPAPCTPADPECCQGTDEHCDGADEFQRPKVCCEGRQCLNKKGKMQCLMCIAEGSQCKHEWEICCDGLSCDDSEQKCISTSNRTGLKSLSLPALSNLNLV